MQNPAAAVLTNDREQLPFKVDSMRIQIFSNIECQVLNCPITESSRVKISCEPRSSLHRPKNSFRFFFPVHSLDLSYEPFIGIAIGL
jgi:hypothetical protein